MRSHFGVLLVSVAMLLGSAAYADAEDKAWIKKCVQDKNARTPDAPLVLKKYCHCMNEKMSDDETKTVVEWEPSHPKEMAACKKETGAK